MKMLDKGLSNSHRFPDAVLVRECNGISDAPYQPRRLEVSETNDEASGHSYVGHQYS